MATAPPHYLKFFLESLPSYAERNGYEGDGWREAVLADLVDSSGALLGEHRVVFEGEEYWFFSPKVVLKTIPDRNRGDSLFVCGIHAGTSRYAGRQPTTRLRSVPGPWAVLPGIYSAPSPVEPVSTFLRRAFGASSAAAEAKPASPSSPPDGVFAHAMQAALVRPASGGPARPVVVLPTRPQLPGITRRPTASRADDQGAVHERTLDAGAAIAVEPPVDPVAPPDNSTPAAIADAKGNGSEAVTEVITENHAPVPGTVPAVTNPLLNSGERVDAAPAAEPAPPTNDRAHGGDLFSELTPSQTPHAVESDQTSPTNGASDQLEAPNPTTENDAWSRWLAFGVESSNPGLRGVLTSESPSATLGERRSALEERIRLLEADLSGQPTDDALDAELARIARLTAAAGAAVLPPPSGEPTPDNLAYAQHLIETAQSEVWRSLPQWAVRGLTGAQWRLDDLVGCTEWIEVEVGNPIPPSFSELEEVVGDTVLERLQHAWRARQALSAIRERLPAGVDAAPFLAASDEARRGVLDFVELWRGCLHPDALRALASSVDWADVGAWRAGVLPVIDLTAQEPDFLELVSDQRTLNNVSKVCRFAKSAGVERPRASAPGPALVSSSRGDTIPVKLGVVHAVTTEAGKVVSARIVVPRDTPEGGLATVRVPIRLRSGGPFASEQIIFVRAEHLKDMPAQRIDDCTELVHTGSGPILRTTTTFTVTEWYRSTGDVSAFLLDVVLTVPAFKPTITRWAAAKQDLRLLIGLDSEFTDSVRMEFPDVSLIGPPASIPLSDTTSADDMCRAPLGIQEKHKSLSAIARKATKSFYIAAPRRFGKTTLFHYLTAEAAAVGDLLVVAEKLERNESPGESTKKLLAAIEEQLRKSLEAAASIRVGDDGLLKVETFRDVRRIVKKHGKRAIVVCVDEAQALVPRADAGRWGNHLKTTLEGSAATSDLAGLVFILVGTTSLQERLGRNCATMLDVGAVESQLNEASLAAFLREIAGDALQSSAGARVELARSAGNLWTLVRLLEIIAENVHIDGRAFFLVPDVRRAVDRLVERESEKVDGNLWSYLSAELSHQDEWDPIDAYPVALAWAAIAPEPIADREFRCAQWINEQLSGTLKFPATVTTERVRSALEDLKRLGVLRPDAAFQRPLLARLLARRADTKPFAQARDEQALARLTVDLVPWSSAAVPIGEGGQASVFIVDDGRKAEAWRKADVHDPDVRRAFVRMCAAIRKLTSRESRLAGDPHLPRIRKAGLNVDDANEGIIVYDWIPGERLDDILATLPELARIDVVRQIALALASLAARGVVHRDVSARNVLVDGNLHASLIDLGMACPADAVGTTIVADAKVTAPEVRAGERATFASDVFSLGELLSPAELPRSSNAQLTALVERVTSVDVNIRPEAKDLADDLAGLLEKAGFKAALVPGHRRVSDVVSRANGWMLDVLMEPDFHEAAVHRCAGFTRWSEDRALEVSRILDTIFVSWIKSGANDEARALGALSWKEGKPSLARVHYALPTPVPRSLQRWSAREVAAVGTLRNAFAHPAERKQLLARLRQQNGYAPGTAESVFKRWEEDVASRLDDATKSGGVLLDYIRLFTAP